MLCGHNDWLRNCFFRFGCVFTGEIGPMTKFMMAYEAIDLQQFQNEFRIHHTQILFQQIIKILLGYVQFTHTDQIIRYIFQNCVLGYAEDSLLPNLHNLLPSRFTEILYFIFPFLTLNKTKHFFYFFLQLQITFLLYFSKTKLFLLSNNRIISNIIINNKYKKHRIQMKNKQNKKGQGSDQSQKEQDNKSDKSDNSNEEPIDTDNSPKIIPVAKLPQKLRTKKIVINISDTQYPIIEEVAEEFGWNIQRSQGIGDWDIWWTDRQINPDTLFKMNLHQKINHFPGIYVLARKNLLGLNLMAMRDRFQQQYNFFPETWVIPLQFAKFRAFYQSTQKNKTRTYIVKPQALSQGRGIFLTRNIQDIMNGRKYVVQRYLKNPLLIDQLKFDLRIYVLLAGTDPLRLYLYEQGLTRFATRKYQQPTDENLNTAFIHLTNYSLNKKNPQYVYNTSLQDINVGHKRSLSSTYQYLEKKGYDVKKLKQQIEDVIIKTIIAGLPAISHQYQYCQPQQYENNMCFHVLGVDIMITSGMKPYLIEINHTPSFQTGTPLDYKVKKNLIIDTLKLMRITSKNKKMLFEKAKVLIKRRVETGKREIVRGEKRQQLLAQAQEKRDREQTELLGGFKKIFPVQNPQKMQYYKRMIQHAEEVHKQTAETRQKIIRQEQDKQKQKTKKRSQSQTENKQIKIIHKSSLNSNKAKQIKQLKQECSTKIIKQRSSEKHVSQQKQPLPIPNIATEKQVTTASKNCNFRTKTKKNLYNPTSEFMLNYLTNHSIKKALQDNVNESEQESFMNVKRLADKKRRDVPSEKMEKEKSKEGTYIIPKMYNIVDSKASLRIQTELIKKISRNKQSASPLLSQSQKLKPLHTYKSIYKKPLFSIY